MESLVEILVPIGICVVLPCLIVFLIVWDKRNEINRKTEVALKAIENGAHVDPNYFSRQDYPKTVKGKVFRYLTRALLSLGLGGALCILGLLPSINKIYLLIPGEILLFLGIAFLVIYFIARKHFAAEIKAEEEKLTKVE